MDSLITAAGRALAAGDPLGALGRVALRDDPPALALRGIAMAQLGDFDRARALLRRAGRAFGSAEVVARARCVVAEAEVALASRDLRGLSDRLDAARATLEAHGDRPNAAHARYLEIRHLLLIGRLDEVEARLSELDPSPLAPPTRAAHELVVAGMAMRRLQAMAASAAIDRARTAADRAGIPALAAEVENAALTLAAPAARLISADGERRLGLDEVETLLASDALIVDGLRHRVGDGQGAISLARRPVLFALARVLGEGWPGDVSREDLVRIAFGGRRADESHRARLRVEIGRLRAMLAPFAGVTATSRGFALTPVRAPGVVVLARPVEERFGAVLALLGDGEAWSSSAVALALGASQRTAQRALESLRESGQVRSYGDGRARRWMVPLGAGTAAPLLLPPSLPGG